MPTITPLNPPLASQVWTWQGFPIRYQQVGDQGPPILCIHGFGASSDHWRKNLPVLGESHRAYAIDLIGYGQSAKPKPVESFAYTFETWGQQILDFCQEVIGEPAFLVANSIGCVVAMQAAVMAAAPIRGIVMLNCSLRLLHDRKQQALPWYRRISAPLLQGLLSFRPLGQFFFAQLATPKTLRRILLQAYSRQEAITDELIELLLAPAQDPAAVDVFLSFIRYSQGPLPEELLPQLMCPVLILWGTDDPWEPIHLGQSLGQYDAVEAFVPLAGVGHCPQDEAPEIVNPRIINWIAQHA
jgi:pimeloyl-ACP methyl ester carboxylesterase